MSTPTIQSGALPPNLQVDLLITQIEMLDEPIAKLSEWANMKKIHNGSIMISGINVRGKEIHQLLSWTKGLAAPVDRLKQFFDLYGQDLIAQRWQLVHQLEQLMSKEIIPGSFGDRRQSDCFKCNTVTEQLHLFSRGSWICTVCHHVQPK